MGVLPGILLMLNNKCKLFIITNPDIFITRDNESHRLAGYKGQKDHMTFL